MSYPISPAPRDVTAGSPYTARALGNIPWSGWCGYFPPSFPLSHTPPVAWPFWPLYWVWPGLATPIKRLSHSESTFWLRRCPQALLSGTRSSIINIPKIVPPFFLPCSKNWPGAHSALCVSHQKLPSRRLSCCQIIFLFFLCLTAPSPRCLRWTSPFSLGVRLVV